MHLVFWAYIIYSDYITVLPAELYKPSSSSSLSSSFSSLFRTKVHSYITKIQEKKRTHRAIWTTALCERGNCLGWK